MNLRVMFCIVDNTELLSKYKNEKGADFFFFSELSALKLQSHIHGSLNMLQTKQNPSP